MLKECVFLVFLCVDQLAGGIGFISPYVGKTVRGLVGSSLQFNWSVTGDVKSIRLGLSAANDPSSLDVTQILLTILKSGPDSSKTPAAYGGRVTGRLISRLATFTLQDLKTSDSRYYVCEVTPLSGGDSPQSDYVLLSVVGPPNIIAISANQTVNEGNDLTLNCTASGNPLSNITWTRLLDNSVVTMPLTKIQRQDEGSYRCTANNSIGNPASRDVFITVYYKPKVTGVSTSVPQNTAIEGQNVTFTCHVTKAKPRVFRYEFYCNNSLFGNETVLKYSIFNVRRSQDYGNYKCRAYNDAGYGESGVILLDIKVPAEIQSLTKNITVRESSPINLTCDATGYPLPTITWRKDGRNMESVSNTLHIRSSTRRDSGAYVCVAANGVKEAVEMKTFITVHYQPNITAATPASKQSWIGQSVKLKCVADGSPTPTITWRKPDGHELKNVTSTENMVVAQMIHDQDFGNYTCEANNIVGTAATRWVQLIQIKAPGSPILTTNDNDIRASSLTLRWTPPIDDGGSSITGYNLIILHGDNVILNMTLSPGARAQIVDGLTKSTNYTLRVLARNKVFQGDASEKKVTTKYEGAPASVEIIGLPSETKNVTVTLKWNETQNNGQPITQYTVYQRIVNDDGTVGQWNKIRVVKPPSIRQVNVELEKNKVYEFVVTATNKHGESLQEGRNVMKLEVLGDVPEPVVIVKAEIEDDQITLTWKKPEENGATITHYSVYKRIANDESWTKVTDVNVTSAVFKLERGKIYELMVTATNKYGPSIVNNNIKTVEVPNGGTADPNARTEPKGVSPAIIAGAAAVAVLLILGVFIFVIWRKRKKTPSETGSATAGLQGPYPDELEGEYSAVGAPSAAQQWQAGGPVPDVTYAQVDKSKKKKKKKTKAPVTDVYAQVDKSKKNNKRNKQPNELEYAELDDFRPNTQPAHQASGATARPLFRAPVYEGTEYADITQFGVPQSAPTYDNVPRKKDVVYSNVESM
ncbi:neural cell adhesion molecule 2-like isoform X1 [Montipora foliosa]|uniref:neural cell adhesion molecule 2-like isoform X1 n=1 Tax=Montipora foliosa TaxID=591990 RepID=UPI0035F14284